MQQNKEKKNGLKRNERNPINQIMNTQQQKKFNL